MAGEDAIIKTLIRAGITLEGEDLAKAKKSLTELGAAFNLDPAKKQAKELGKLLTQVKKDKTLLDRAATTPDRLTRGQQARLPEAFGRLKTFQDQLGKLANTLRNAGNAEQIPMFRHLTGLEKIMASLGATSRNIAPLIDNVTKSFKANSAAVRQAQTDAVRNQRLEESRARTTETLERARRTKAIQSPEGRKAFLTAARGNAGAVETSASAKQGRAFAASALTASERAVRLQQDKFGTDSPEARRAERKLALSAQAFNDLDTRATQLAAQEAAARQTKRTRDAQAIRQQVIDTNARVAQQKNPTGQKAFYAAARGDTASIETSKNASSGLAFAEKELSARTQINRLTREMFGAESKEAQRTARELDAVSQAYARLTDRVEELRQVEKLRKKDEAAANAVAKAESNASFNRTLRGRAERQGRKALQQAGGVDGNVDAFTDIGAARKAQAFVRGEMNDLATLQRNYANAFGASSDQAKRAGREAEKYGDYLDKLRGRIEVLNSAKVEQNSLDRLQEKIQTSEDKRRTRGTVNAKGKQLFERADGDYSQLSTLGDVRKATKFAENELRQLELQQQATAKEAGRDSDAYKQVSAEVDKYARSVAELNAQQERLAQNSKTRVSRPSRSAVGSAVYPEGRKIYQDASKAPGGLVNLNEEDAKSARQYVQARLSEVRGKGKEFSNLYGVSSTQAVAAGNAARKFAGDLDVLNEAIKPPSSGLNLLQSTLRSFLKYAVGYAALYGLAAALGALARGVVDLQTAFLDIQAVTGSTDAQMGKLSQTVLDVAKNSKFSLTELTEAAKVLAQAGVSVEDMNTTLKATADFAAATGSNLQVAADLISTTRSVFKELSDDVIANQLAKAINISKLTGEDLKTILSLGAQTAKSFGLTSEQFLAAVSTLRNAGLKASTAATGLRQGMLEIFSPDLKLTKALQERYRAMGEEMGAEAVKARFFAFSKGRAPLQAALTELKRLGFNDEGALGLSRAFDIRSANAIKAMISNLEELAANESKITFGRAAAEGADTTIKGLEASFTRLKSTISGFTYNRSEGVLAFFTDVINYADKAIQALDRYDLHKRAQGESGLPGAGELLLGGAPRQVLQFAYRHTVGRLFPGEQSADEAGAQATAQGQEINQAEDLFQKYDQAAKTWDIKLAELGQNVGSTAESLLTASRTADDLNAAISNVFGTNLSKSNEQVLELVKSYTKLAPSERADQLEVLKTQFPQMAALIQGMTKSEADRALFTIEELGNTVSGTLKGMTDQLNTKLVNARKTLDKMDGAAPANEQELEAQLYQQIVAQSESLQQILAGTSKEAMDMQLGILQQAAQTLADQMRANGAVNPLDANAKKVSEQFIQRIKAISLSDNKSTAEADMRAAVIELLARFHELDGAAIGHLQEIQGALFDAANQLKGGLMKNLLTLSVGKIQETLDSQATKVLQETADRVKYGETIAKTFNNPKFLAYLKKTTDAKTGGAQQLFSDISAGGVPEDEARGNTQRYQFAASKVKEYRDVQGRQDQLVEETTKETKKQLAMEQARTKAAEEYEQARTDKQFGLAKAKLVELTNAEIAIEQRKAKEAQDELDLDVGKDPEKNKGLIRRRIEAEARIGELQQKQAKEASRIDREASKVDLSRAQGQKTAEQRRLKGVLDNATNLTPQAVIDDTIKQYDQVNKDLLEIFERRKALEGSLTGQSEAEVEERKKLLVPYKQQADYLELVFRRERQTRDEIDDQLALALSTGNLLNDARLEDKGLEPGDRTQRRDYLLRNRDLLIQKGNSAQGSLQFAQDKVGELTAASLQDKDNKHISESLRVARAEVNELHRVLADTNTELGNTELALERVTGTWESGFKRAFDPNVIQRSLEQSESSLEHFGEVINDHVVTAIEGIGDAFADAVVDGKSLSGTLDEVFSQLSKETMRTLIKTLSNETIGSLTGTLFGSNKGPGQQQQGAIPALLARFGWGGSPKTGEATNTTSQATQPVSFMDSVVSTLTGNTVSKEDGCCLPPETGVALKKVAEGPGLANLVETEGKGFFEELGGGFVGLLDDVTKGFGSVFGNLGGLLGLASKTGAGQASGLLSFATMAGSLLAGGAGGGSATYKGAYGFAGGGIISGPGTGTSDSIPAYLTGPSGQHQELRVSNGEAILNAKATAALGADFIHSVNNGRMLNASSSYVMNDQASLSGSMPAAPVSQGGRSGGGTDTYNVHVTPAQMRMRMGDWLDQQILNERAKR
jgi:TP901 family phage tail tape measure protein